MVGSNLSLNGSIGGNLDSGIQQIFRRNSRRYQTLPPKFSPATSQLLHSPAGLNLDSPDNVNQLIDLLPVNDSSPEYKPVPNPIDKWIRR